MSDYRIIHDDELMHYGVLGMKWGVRRDKSSFNTNYRPTGLTRPSGFRGERIAYTKGHDRISDRKAERAALREGRSYRRTFKDKANDKDELSVIGNKYHEEATKRETRKADKKEYKQTDEYKAKRAKAIKVGAAAAGTALAAYGAYKVSKIVKQKYSEQLADKIIREYGHESIRSYNMFVKDTASRVKTKEAVVGLAKFSNEKKRIAKYKERLAKEAVERAQNDAQMEYIKRMIGNQKSNRAYY